MNKQVNVLNVEWIWQKSKISLSKTSEFDENVAKIQFATFFV